MTCATRPQPTTPTRSLDGVERSTNGDTLIPPAPSQACDRLAFMTRVRLALVGAGRMGSAHVRALSAGHDVELAAVVEPSDEAARRSGIARRHRDVDELLAVGGVDGAIVAAPTRLHAPLVAQ